MSKGKYIVIEGIRGVGKTPQVLILAKKLQAAGLQTKIFNEVSQKTKVATKAAQLIIGDEGYSANTRTEILLRNVAKSKNLKDIMRNVDNGVYCISDQNFLSTLASEFYGRDSAPDYSVTNSITELANMNIDPDLTIIMDSPINELIKRANRGEGQLNEIYLEKVRAGYLWEANQRNYPIVFMTSGIEEASDEIWDLVKSIIPKENLNETKSKEPSSIKTILEEKAVKVSPQSGEQLIESKFSSKNIKTKTSDAPRKLNLEDLVTNAEGSVYAFTSKLNTARVLPALLASYHGEDLRKELLEIIDKDSRLEESIKPTNSLITRYMVIEGISKLVVNEIASAQLVTLRELSEGVDYSKKDGDGHYKFFVPTNLDNNSKKQYVRKLNFIFSIYSDISKQLSMQKSTKKTKVINYLRLLLPVCFKTSVVIYGPDSAIKNLIIHLRSSSLIEANDIGRKIQDNFLTVANKTSDPDKQSIDWDKEASLLKTKNQEAKHLANKLLPNNYINVDSDIVLSYYYPKNELEILSDILYKNSNLSIKEISLQLDSWNIKRKSDFIIDQAGAPNNNFALNRVRYSCDLVCTFETFSEMMRYGIGNLVLQELTPAYGYDTPKDIDEFNLSEKYQDCFEESIELYSLMQASKYIQEAQYTTLLGHKQRFNFTIDATKISYLHDLEIKRDGSTELKRIIQILLGKIEEVHPLIYGALTDG